MNDTSRWLIFLLATAGILYISRKSLNFRAHGFYRFYAWEILLVMFLLNIATWFQNPFTWYQLISWTLLIGSIVLVTLGLRLLRQIGEQDTGRKEASLLEMEKTSTLITVGLYRYIRHPLYSSLLFLAWGIFFKSPSWLDALLVLLCTVFLIATAHVEESENIRYFGSEYAEYMKRTKMFVPFLF